MPKINMQANTLLSSLISSKNVSVIHEMGGEPKYDTKNQVLTIPILADDVGGDVYTTFIGSEIAKAAYSPNDTKVEGLPEEYVSVVEGNRAERQLVRKYMGLQSIFERGHDELLEKGFYGISSSDQLELQDHFMDRLNMYGKLGDTRGVIPFTDEEKVFRDEFVQTDTWEESVELTRRIVEFLDEPPQPEGSGEGEGEGQGEGEGEGSGQGGGSGTANGGGGASSGNRDTSNNGQDYDNPSKPKPQPKSPPKQQEPEKPEDESGKGDDNKGDDGKDDESDKGDDAGHGSDAGRDTETQEPPKPKGAQGPRKPEEMKTKKDFSAVTDKSSTNLVRTSRNNAPIVPFDLYVKNTMSHAGTPDGTFVDKYKAFVLEQNQLIQTMVNEFNVKKAAYALQREGQARTGKLDTLMLSQFKFTDDLFLNDTVVPQQKNHGLVILLDNSGSMSHTSPRLCGDIYVLAEFCRRTNIPLEVYQFTDGHGGYRSTSKTVEGDINYGGAIMVEIMNTRSSTQKYDHARKFLAARSFQEDHYYHNSNSAYSNNVCGSTYNIMHCTPLVESYVMLFMAVNDFKDRHEVEVMNTMVLTDGCGNGTLYKRIKGDTHKPMNSENLIVEFRGYGMHRLTHDNNSYARYGQQGYEAAMLKEIQGVSKVIGYFVGGDTGLSDHDSAKHFKTKGYVQIEKDGHDEYFMLPAGMEYTTNQKDVVEQSLAKQAKRTMIRKLAGSLSAH